MKDSLTPKPLRKTSAKLVWGFTVLEALVVISIIVLLAALTLFSFSDLNKVQALDRSVSTVISFLEEARSLTLSSVNATSYGVLFSISDNSITLFEGQEFDSDNIIKTTSIHSAVEISDLDLEGGGAEVVFQRLTGETEQDGKVTLSLEDDPSNLRIISIFSTGLVELE